MKTQTSIICLIGVWTTLLISSCNKEYLDAKDIHYSIKMADTVYLNEPTTIQVNSMQGLEIRIFLQEWGDEHLLGTVKTERDSIIWTPKNLEEGPIGLYTQATYQSGRHKQNNQIGLEKTYVKKRNEDN